MKELWRIVYWDIIRTGLLHGWPGVRCPECGTKPMKMHRDGCSVGQRDGGRWA